MDILGKDKMFDPDKWNLSDLALANEFIIKRRIDVVMNEEGDTQKMSLNDAFWQIYINADKAKKYKNQDKTEVPLHISSDHSEPLGKFVDENIDEWNSLPNSVQDLVSVLFLKGIKGLNPRTNISTLMPFDLMSPRILEKFLPLFESNLKSLQKTGLTQTGDTRATKGYKRISAVSVASRNARKNFPDRLKPRCK